MEAPFNLVEVIGKRSSNAKHYRLEDGTYQAHIFGGEIHYQDANNQWHDIEVMLFDDAEFDVINFPVYSEKHKEFILRKMEVQKFKEKGMHDRNRGYFHGLRVPHDSKIAKRFDKGYEIGKGADRLKFMPIDSSPVVGSIDAANKSVVRYVDAWMKTDIMLELQRNGIKETIILKDAGAPKSFSFAVMGSLTADLTCGSLKLGPAWLQDAHGIKRDVTQTLRMDASGNMFIDLVADTTGLTYPVEIDPTVVVQPTGFTSGLNQSGAIEQNYNSPYGFGGTNGNTSVTFVGMHGISSGYPDRALYQFDFSSIPAGAGILSATLDLTVQSYSGSTWYTMSFWAVQNLVSWDYNTLIWSNAPATSSTKGASIGPLSSGPLAGTVYHVDIKSIAQNWANGSPNYGVTLISDRESGSTALQGISFRGINNGTTSMTVTYDAPPTASGAITYPNAGAVVNKQATIQWGTANDSSNVQILNTNSAYTTLNYNSSTPTNYRYVAQTFTTAADATYFWSAQVQMASSTVGLAYNLTGYIYDTDTNGAPTTQVVGTTGVTIIGNTTTTGIATFTFNGFSATLQPNKKYAFVVVFNSLSSGMMYYEMSSAQPANFGTAYTYSGTGSPGVGNWSNFSYWMLVSLNFSTSNSQLTYQIDLSRDNGSTWTNIVNQTVAGATSYTYDFTNQVETSTAQLRVRAYDGIAYGPYTNSSVFTIQHNQSPNAPAHAYISNLGGSYSKRPKFFVNVSDPDSGNTIQNVEFQIATDSGFAVILVDVQKGSDAGFGATTAGWSGIPTIGNASTQINWTPQTDLPVQTLYVRVRSKDNNGVWSLWSTTQQFSVLTMDSWSLLRANQNGLSNGNTLGFNAATGGASPAPTLSVDSSVRYEDQNSLKIVGTASASGQGVYLDRVQGDPTGTYTFIAYVKGTAGDAFYSTLEEWDSLTGGSQKKVTSSNYVTLTGGWDRIEVTATMIGYGYMVGTVRHSFAQSFTIWVDNFQLAKDPIRVGDSGCKAQWLNDLATAINNVRQFRGLATYPFTDGTITPQDSNGNGTDIKALHITERRTKITDVYTQIGATAPSWANATIDSTNDRNGQDIIELRNAVTSL